MTPSVSLPSYFSAAEEVIVKPGYVYIMASGKNGTLYVGVTSNLPGRVYQHMNGLVDGFTKEYQVHRLVYYEVHASMADAIQREKRIKKWNRTWKIRLIRRFNPEWGDLYPAIAS